MTPPSEQPAARTITHVCWSVRPGHPPLHCTLSPRHKGDHYHYYTRTAWPQRPSS
ncbi:hypothetical protein [Streptomyces sp. SP18CS02]|uniref:hypothetical protein n=1 Tax=Streptomyces sp. SP18CS02 TaxID=3002531 RepID=UPI002E7914D2|nr:hypothetical protein [Streptomyces sp. SP18CS02]MEE1753752.1 hypothetical protein [Streptomyces sp. SP18CS02]